MQDAGGLIWIGTENGLNLLDPVSNTIRSYIHNDNDAASLPAGPIRGIHTMKDGSVWIMSETWFAKCYLPGHFIKVGLAPSLLGPTKVFTGLIAGNKDRWWISYLDQPAAQATIYARPNYHDSLIASNIKRPRNSMVYVDRDHNTWGISYYGVTRLNDSTGQFQPWLKNSFAGRIPNLHVYTCYEADEAGNIWQGSRQTNLVKYNLPQRQVTDYNWLLKAGNATMVYCIYRDNNNTQWIGTDNGVLKLPDRNAFFKNIPCLINGIELKDIRCRKIIQDNRGALYAGTESHGLLKITRSSDVSSNASPNASPDVSSNIPPSVLTDVSSNASPDGMYHTRQLSAYGAFPVSSLPLRDNSIDVPLNGHYDIGFTYDMWYDQNLTLWLAGYGLGRYDIRTDAMTIYLADGDEQTRRESITLFSICPDDSLFWAGGQHNLYIFDTVTRRMRVFLDNKGKMPFHDLPCWSLVKKGQFIWAGTDKGLYKIDRKTRTVTRENTYPELEFGINAIHIDTDGSFWISTAGGGVLHYNTENQQLQQYTTADGLSNNTICGIVPDARNNLWISTYAGLSFLDRQSGQFTVFYEKDGLNMNEFNRKAFTRLANGQIIVGGLNGYMIFDPKEVFSVNQPVSLLLTRFRRTTSSGAAIENIFSGVTTLPEVVIKPGDPFFSFTYTLTDMYDPGGNRYSYMLEGLDKDWHYIGNQHTLSFNSLPAGNYTLRIKGSPPKGAPAANQLALSIRVEQVFYRSPWFMIGVLLLAAGIVFAVVQYRIDQWRKLQNLRTRIASDLHDEVGSNLVRIILLADAGRNRANSGTGTERNESNSKAPAVRYSEVNDSIKAQLDLIAGISRNAISTIKDVIWSIDSRNDTMAGTLDHMHEHVHNMLVPADIEYQFLHSGLQDNEKLKMDFRQNIYLIFKEAINNIVKHARASQVLLEIKREEGCFTMSIKDNGQGMTDKGRHSGQGLGNMQMRAARVRGRLTVDSQSSGVTIILTIPV